MTRPRTLSVGDIFGRLTVTEWLGAGKCMAHCSCGKVKEVWVANLRNQSTVSCGCLRGARLMPDWKPEPVKLLGPVGPYAIAGPCVRGYRWFDVRGWR